MTPAASVTKAGAPQRLRRTSPQTAISPPDKMKAMARAVVAARTERRHGGRPLWPIYPSASSGRAATTTRAIAFILSGGEIAVCGAVLPSPCGAPTFVTLAAGVTGILPVARRPGGGAR